MISLEEFEGDFCHRPADHPIKVRHMRYYSQGSNPNCDSFTSTHCSCQLTQFVHTDSSVRVAACVLLYSRR